MTQEEAINSIFGGDDVFLTGGPGTGKTHVINTIKSMIRNRNVACTATTGIAATHIDGKTIHSWAGIGIKGEAELNNLSVLEDIAHKKWTRERVRQTDILIIDEISMLHPYQLQAVNLICQYARNTSALFGGIQTVLCGDFFQLPPVLDNYHANDKTYVFEAEIWEHLDPKICYLYQTYRHDDTVFISILNEIRRNSISDSNKTMLYNKINQPIDNKYNPTKLFATNADVDAINNLELAKIQEQPHFFTMDKWAINDFALKSLLKACLAPEILQLKVGAIVMFLKNHGSSYANGTIGKVIRFDEDGDPVVETTNGTIVHVQPDAWERQEYNKSSGLSETIASVTQLPIRLAWAITIHKSQGMSLDCAAMDLSKSFEDGMGYVGLSRVRSLSGIKLLGLNDQALRVDDKVIAFDEGIKDM